MSTKSKKSKGTTQPLLANYSKNLRRKESPRNETDDRSKSPNKETREKMAAMSTENINENEESVLQPQLSQIISLITEMREEMNSKFEIFQQEISSVKQEIDNNKLEIHKATERIDTLEENMGELGEAFQTNTKILEDSLKRETDNTRGQIKCLQDELTHRNIQDRKLNLIIHGIEGTEKNKQETEKIIRDFAKNELKMTDEEAQQLLLVDVYCLSNPRTKANEKPDPIIIKLGKWRQKEQFMQMAKNLKNTPYRIVTDLPPILQKERAKLARVAYNLRTVEKKQTRIRLAGVNVILEKRDGNDQPWNKHNMD